MDWIPAPKKPPEPQQSGIALFMVIGALSVMSILVTELAYVSQVNQKLAYDGLDQLKAHYLAKTGLKFSLLRLKAYLSVKNYINGMVKASGAGAAAQSMVPQALIDKIWEMPLSLPFTAIPGMTPADKEKIDAFQKASAIEGKVSTYITSESNRFNLNSILAGYAPEPSPSPSASPTPGAPGPSATPSATPSFNPEVARNQLKTLLGSLLAAKMEEDQQFADAYRDPHLLDDLMDKIVAWADPSYELKTQVGEVQMKKAPFYSVNELRMIPGMDDDLFSLFAPNLTVARTPGINVNSITESMLKGLFPLGTKEEIEQFFKDRDSEETDGKFKSEEDFYKYIQSKFQAYGRGNTLEELRKQFTEAKVRFITEENEFKISVRAEMNQSTRIIEAWVSLGSKTPSTGPSPGPSGVPTPAATVNLSGNGPTAPPPDPGVKIHFMRVL